MPSNIKKIANVLKDHYETFNLLEKYNWKIPDSFPIDILDSLNQIINKTSI